jgi:hypothetical protein
MSDNDLIRRGDALKALDWGDIYGRNAQDAIAALPAVTVGVRPLVWENFDAWEYWARSPVGTYYVRERNGVWKAVLDAKAGMTIVYEYTTDGLTPEDYQAAKTAAQADYTARILAALTTAPAPKIVVRPDRDTFDAMCAMRDAINEHIPMPSLESDLLQGPENSVFCATVAEAVIGEVRRLRAALTTAPAPDAPAMLEVMVGDFA